MLMDIVERLRENCEDVCYEAADEIERLRKENRILLEAAAKLENGMFNAFYAFEKTVDDLERAALKESE